MRKTLCVYSLKIRMTDKKIQTCSFENVPLFCVLKIIMGIKESKVANIRLLFAVYTLLRKGKFDALSIAFYFSNGLFYLNDILHPLPFLSHVHLLLVTATLNYVYRWVNSSSQPVMESASHAWRASFHHNKWLSSHSSP